MKPVSTSSRSHFPLLATAENTSPVTVDPLIGVTIAGRYHVVECIGVGGMGNVYRATQKGLGRPVALKVLRRELIWDQDQVIRFHREAKAMSLLVHANTVRVFDFGETEEGLLYLALELLEGEVITRKLDREGALDPSDAVGIATQILRSLQEAHSKGIVHRDLKPDNIFVANVEGQSEPIVKVLDFGIAKMVFGDRRIDPLETQAGTVFGTPRYMSPEQAQGIALDGRSDVYAVGILLYQFLVGRPPFVDQDAVVVMAKHIRERPDPFKLAAPDRAIPRSLERAVFKAMEKEPDRRFQTAAEFADELDRCASEMPITGIVRRAPAIRKRRKALAIGLASVLVLLVTGIAFYFATLAGNAQAGKLEHTRAIPSRSALSASTTDSAPDRPHSPELAPGSTPAGPIPAPAASTSVDPKPTLTTPTEHAAVTPDTPPLRRQKRARIARARRAPVATPTERPASDPYERFD